MRIALCDHMYTWFNMVTLMEHLATCIIWQGTRIGKILNKKSARNSKRKMCLLFQPCFISYCTCPLSITNCQFKNDIVHQYSKYYLFYPFSEDNIHHLPNPVKVHGKAPAASIIARTPSPPAPGEFGEDLYIPPAQTNFSIYLTHDRQFDVSSFNFL